MRQKEAVLAAPLPLNPGARTRVLEQAKATPFALEPQIRRTTAPLAAQARFRSCAMSLRADTRAKSAQPSAFQGYLKGRDSLPSTLPYKTGNFHWQRRISTGCRNQRHGAIHRTVLLRGTWPESALGVPEPVHLLVGKPRRLMPFAR